MPDTWITPRVWTAGERVGQSKMNEISNNFRSLFPYTTAGDIAYRDAAGAYLSRLAVGAAGGLLKADGSVPSWLAGPDAIGILKNDQGGSLGYVTGGNALDVLRRNAANNAFEFASVGIKYCVARHSADFSHTSGHISWNQDLLDPFDWHSTSSNTSRITVAEAGVFICGGTLRWYEISGGATRNGSGFFSLNGTKINNTELALYYASDNISKGLNPISRPIEAGAGHYFEMGAGIEGGRTVIADYSCFWVIKIA